MASKDLVNESKLTSALSNKQDSLIINPSTTSATLNTLGINGTNYVLGGGGGGGGLYKHTCSFTFSGGTVTGVKINDSSTPFVGNITANFDGMGATTSIGFGGVIVTETGTITLLYGVGQSTTLTFVSDTVTAI